MSSYLEMALRVATSGGPFIESEKPQPTHVRVTSSTSTSLSRLETDGSGSLAPCGSSNCAGCYEVASGVRIHPPKCGEDYLEWLERWEAKGKTQ